MDVSADLWFTMWHKHVVQGNLCAGSIPQEMEYQQHARFKTTNELSSISHQKEAP